MPVPRHPPGYQAPSNILSTHAAAWIHSSIPTRNSQWYAVSLTLISRTINASHPYRYYSAIEFLIVRIYILEHHRCVTRFTTSVVPIPGNHRVNINLEHLLQNHHYTIQNLDHFYKSKNPACSKTPCPVTSPPFSQSPPSYSRSVRVGVKSGRVVGGRFKKPDMSRS